MSNLESPQKQRHLRLLTEESPDSLRLKFDNELLQRADRECRARRHRYVDFEEFMGDRNFWRRHYLIMGATGAHHAYDQCHHVSLYDHSHHPYPPHLLIRPYLKGLSFAQGGEFPTITSPELLDREPPLFYSGPALRGNLAYIDIDAAYWQIYRPLTLDLLYNGTQYPVQGNVKFLGADELLPYKFARNALVGTLHATTRIEVDFGKAKRVEIPPTWRRPALWAFIMDVLEGVGWDMRQMFGAGYVMTDGYVMPADLANDAMAYLANRWGLVASLRAVGEGYVSGVGSWQIGDQIAGTPRTNPDPPEIVDNMSLDKEYQNLRSWLRDAQDYRTETREIVCKRLDGRSVVW